MKSFSTVGAENLHPIAPRHGIILDVRTKVEHNEKHIGFDHAHVPLDELNPSEFMKQHGLGRDAEIYILCLSGKRASQAAEVFITNGYLNIKVIEGGIVACEEFGYQMKGYRAKTSSNAQKDKIPLSLERQVRIATGLFTAAGSAFGLLVSPLFTFIPLLVGCGLIFAGVTDRCGLALLLARAPWNKPDKPSCAAPSCSLKRSCNAVNANPKKNK